MATDELVLDLIQQWEDLRLRGVPATPEEVCASRPDLLVAVRDGVRALRALNPLLGACDPAPDTRSGPRPEPDPDLPAPAAFARARYRPVRFHRRGGQGEVFLAHDADLDRPVAVKRIRPGHGLDPAARRRFVREAAVCGRLQHPGIVPVYTLGADAAGQPYYAMRFVEGETLADTVKRFHEASVEPSGRRDSVNLVGLTARRSPGFDSLEFRQLLTRFVTVCQTIAYAHSQGVIHRDLKPHNILLGPFGETLVVDWGLAKAVEPQRTEDRGTEKETALSGPLSSVLCGSSPDESELTEVGGVVGTAAYMSPEQARGDEAGPASDVYGLGATLYAVLTGGPPVGGASVYTALEAARLGTIVPPREKVPWVPPALDAVCRKALAVDPAGRYATALDLAADLERWLADEPVGCYREPMGVRLRRWGRRHRTLVTTAAAAVVLAAAGLGALAWQRERARWDIEREQHQTAAERDKARDERDRAVAARQETRAALDAMTSDVTGDALTTQTALSPEQEKFLRGVLGTYEKFAAEPGEDRAARWRLAEAHKKLAWIRYRLGEAEAGAAVLRRAVELHEALAADYPDVPEYRLALAQGHHNLGYLLNAQGKRAEAEVAFRTALIVQERLAADHPGVPRYRHDLAMSHNNLGVLMKDQGKRTEAAAAHRAALALYEKLAADDSGVPDYRLQLAGSHINLGYLLDGLGRREESAAAFRAALAVQERLAAEYPRVPNYRRALAMSHNNLGVLLKDQGKGAEAEAAHRAALAMRERLAAEYPGVPDYRCDLATSHINLGYLLDGLDRRAEAETAYRAALAALERLAAEYPGVPDYRHILTASHNNLGLLLVGLGRRAEAEAAYRAALAMRERLAADYPGVPKYRHDLAISHNNLGILLDKLGRRAEAEAAHRRAFELLERLAADHPAVPAYRQELATSRLNLGLLRARAGDHAKAAAEVETLVTAKDATVDVLYDAACVFSLASAAAKDDSNLADRYATRAVALLRQAVAKGYNDAAHLRADPDLDPLRGRADFRKLIAGLTGRERK